MASQYLKGQRVAILTTDGFEQSELIEPRKALEAAGAKVDVISPQGGSVKGWNHTDWGQSVDVDMTLADANADDYAALMLPGGVMNPDKLRIDEEAVQFVQSFVDARKPIAAICHGPQILIETGMVKGRQMTSWPSLKTDLINAGANWVDQEVVTDQGLVTSRKPDDIPAFNKKMIEEFAEGVHDPSAGRDRSQSAVNSHP
ncbi:MAG TPA: type 1 glutamine amidotransferase domain-containing protein [Oligoflexus sp.]|uniref:type 1 glutamine amidotransferase domain-containing protein n=1 Tax=Oligoflexus sp. TaxID=1971216 RepID=UPI002D622753|nr:type 1 glutamine amidotransferase domain-containing protein [Oligoflexus sp.]HYX31810.1 type 1 glutamine amidotransferase domain-containing protein [Oligoflexus sp.]